MMIAALMGLSSVVEGNSRWASEGTTTVTEVSVGASERPAGGDHDGERLPDGVKVPGTTSTISASASRVDAAVAVVETGAAAVASFVVTA